MFTVNRIGIGFCVQRILEICSGGCEPELEGDCSRVVVAIGKRETAIYLKGGVEDGGSQCRANVVTPNKKCIILNTHSVHTTLRFPSRLNTCFSKRSVINAVIK